MLTLMYVGGALVVSFGAWVFRKGLMAKDSDNSVTWELKRGYI